MSDKAKVLRQFPQAAWCPVTRRVYFGNCMSKSRSSWKRAAEAIGRKP